MTTSDTQPTLPPDHFIAVMALALSEDGSTSKGSAPVRPELFAPGTNTIRTGLLATMVDVVAGHAPSGAIGPTVDLRLQILAPPPTTGRVRLQCQPLRVGRRLVVSETLLRSESSDAVFGRALTTFMNIAVGEGLHSVEVDPPPMPEASFDEFIGYRVRDETSLELTPCLRLSNGPMGTVQGGVQATLAEITVEHAFGQGRRLAASDLDIRFLDRVRVGPFVANAELLSRHSERVTARVRFTDAGDNDRLLGFVALTLEPCLR